MAIQTTLADVTQCVTTLRRHIASALTLSMLALCSATSHAADYTIAPGPLGKVLAEFGAQSGVLLSFDPQQLQGRQSPGLQGDYSVQEGFATLLAGTGLQEVADSQGRYQLHDANQGVMTLDLIKV